MGDNLTDLFFGDAIIESAPDVSTQLLGAIQGREDADRDHAAIAFGELGALPHVAKQHIGGELSQFRRNLLLDSSGFSNNASFANSSSSLDSTKIHARAVYYGRVDSHSVCEGRPVKGNKASTVMNL